MASHPIIYSVFASVAGSATWLAWNWEGNAKRKRPFGKSNDPSTWKTLAEANAAQRNVGLVLTDRELCGGIVCVDLDGCREPQTGEVSGWAQHIIERLNSYSEVSPSGTGVKVFLRSDAALPDGKRKIAEPAVVGKKPAIELFAGESARYVAITGEHIMDTPLDLAPVTSELWSSLTREKHGQADDEPPVSDLEQELERVADALSYIPADEHDLWKTITAALKHAVGNGELNEDDAFRVWDEWSATSDSYDQMDNLKAWRSFRRSEETGRKVATIGSVFYLAKEFGWPGFVIGSTGPVPLGRLKDGNFAVLDQNAHVVRSFGAETLVSTASLMGLAPLSFWKRNFPEKKRLFNAYAAGAAIMEACTAKGAFNPKRVRGRGVWLENERVIENLSGKKIEDTELLYLCFDPLKLEATDSIDARAIYDWLKLFNWARPQDATLFFGYLAFAPICGVVEWRPHVFLHGPPETGKSVLLGTATRLLTPLVVAADGASTEAGIRQSLGPDSLPVVVDEFESDHDQRRLQAIVKLMRSASSAEHPVLRGTPDGKAMQFALRTTFLFGAVNPVAGSAADDSRLAMLELSRHRGDREIAKQIEEGQRAFDKLGPAWCARAVEYAPFLPEAIVTMRAAMVGVGERHRKNMGTLLAAAWVALEGRVPTTGEAERWVTQHADAIELHGEAHQRDDAIEALEHLLSVEERVTVVVRQDAESGDMFTQMEDKPLRLIIAEAYEKDIEVLDGFDIRVLRNFEGVNRGTGAKEGPDDYICLRAQSAYLKRVFAQTKWANWAPALRKLDGAYDHQNPLRFGSVGKVRAVLVPVRHWWLGEDDDERAPPPKY
ncbi:MAG TPA: PriCT-2 domain-containing protein [Devosiaceae bacterium]|jgi:hypothetical protein|nr:PriCT-2 domain-containing protein [Devosiaceae bacterium]